MENFTKLMARGGKLCAATWMILMGAVACGNVENGSAPAEFPSTREQGLEGTNGLTLNGLAQNGLAQNGLAQNGLAQNGLAQNGLAQNGLMGEDFSTWFSQAPEVNSMLMKYVVQCALLAGESRGYQDPSTGTTYAWEGNLGLAPGWANGQPMTEAEQQLLSACLAAHVNKFGLHVPLSVLGRTAQQEPIPYTAEELETFSRREGCFFGNLFTNEGLFAGVDGGYLNNGESSPRACGLSTEQDALVSQCNPIVHVESCETLCTLDESGLFYTQCTYNGRTYLPLTTRIRTSDVYTCGDGVCQFTESCGDGSETNNCMNDCGACQ